MEVDGEQILQRKHSHYHNLDEVFMVRNEVYKGQQYSQIYFARLHMLRTLLYSLVPHWKPHIPVCTILGLEENKECIVVGTLYKHMKLKPCILDEYAKERSVTSLVKPHNFMHPDDHLILEDESGRVKLEGTSLFPSVYVTGVVVAFLGKESGAGSFLVHDILEAGLPPQIEKPLKLGDDKYVVFVSGLSVGNSTSNPLQFQLLVDHITGHLGDENEQRIAAEIVHVVIAGNFCRIARGLFNGQNLGSKDQSKLSEPFRELDILLTQIAAGVPLDIIFLGTSGQNIDDLDKYSEAKDKLDFLERTLRWRHLAPSAPNTLGCYPFTDRDPFVIESCPHVYFVGNQDMFGSRLVKGPEGQLTQLITIPKFCETGVAVVLNLRNLECHALSFGTQFSF